MLNIFRASSSCCWPAPGVAHRADTRIFDIPAKTRPCGSASRRKKETIGSTDCSLLSWLPAGKPTGARRAKAASPQIVWNNGVARFTGLPRQIQDFPALTQGCMTGSRSR